MGATAEQRLRGLLETAAAELAERREDVLSATLIWPTGGVAQEQCVAFLRALDAERAVLEAAGYVTVPPHGRFSLLRRSGIGVGVRLDHLARVSALAG